MTDPDTPVCLIDRRPSDDRVCDPCRARGANWLAAIPRMYGALPAFLPTNAGTPRADVLNLLAPGNPDPAELLVQQVDTWSEWVEVPTTTMDGQPTVIRFQHWHRDLVFDHDGRPVMVPTGDQTGALPVALWLTWWAADWRARYGAAGWRQFTDPDRGYRPNRVPDRRLYMELATTEAGRLRGQPVADPVEAELRVRFGVPVERADVRYAGTYLGLRWDAACDTHPDITLFIDQLRVQHGILKRAIGEGDDLVYLGRCPELLINRDTGMEEPCGARLWQDPFATVIRCPRCRSETTGRRWVRLSRRIRAVWGAQDHDPVLPKPLEAGQPCGVCARPVAGLVEHRVGKLRWVVVEGCGHWWLGTVKDRDQRWAPANARPPAEPEAEAA
jgi:hypothetical protein